MPNPVLSEEMATLCRTRIFHALAPSAGRSAPLEAFKRVAELLVTLAKDTKHVHLRDASVPVEQIDEIVKGLATISVSPRKLVSSARVRLKHSQVESEKASTFKALAYSVVILAFKKSAQGSEALEVYTLQSAGHHGQN